MIKIFGKSYITVAERLKLAQKDLISINTDVIFQEPVVVKATVVTKAGTFTGISAANPKKMIEKSSPYEVAETSAVGRALGFAGYGITDSIATADEMAKVDADPDWIQKESEAEEKLSTIARKCNIHNVPLLRALSKTKLDSKGNPKPYWYHPLPNSGMCFGNEV